MMNRINSRSKGANGEREFCKWLKDNLNLDSLPERNLEQVRSGGADIICVKPFIFEVKRVENLDLQKAWVQVKCSQRESGHPFGEPIVAFRYNRKPWEFLISANHIGLELGYIRLTEKIFIEWANKLLHERI